MAATTGRSGEAARGAPGAAAGSAPGASAGAGAAGSAPAASAVRPGALVALEGIDGSGKSRLAAALGARLAAAGVPVRLTREPTDTWLGQAVRRGIREHGDPFQDAFLFLADHAAHAAEVRAWRAAGEVVVSDRWGDSCLAYQAAALAPRLGAGAMAWLEAAQRPVTLRPDVVLLLDLAPAKALGRIQGREELAKFEQAAFLERVRRNYLDLAGRMPGYVVLDAAVPGERLAAEAWESLRPRLGL